MSEIHEPTPAPARTGDEAPPAASPASPASPAPSAQAESPAPMAPPAQAAPAPVDATPRGRVLEAQIMLIYPDENGTEHQKSFVIWCPDSMESFHAQTEMHVVEGDARERCKAVLELWDKLLPMVTPPVVDILQGAGYPPMLDDQKARLPCGEINPKHAFIRMDLYYGKGEHSAYVVFWYRGAAPVVMDFPPSIIMPSACTICDACDPTGERRRTIARLLQEQGAAFEQMAASAEKS